MMSHTAQTAVPTVVGSFKDIGTIQVPAGAARIARIRCGLAPDEADPAGVRLCPVFRMLGAGLLEQNPHEYPGPMGNITAKTTSGAYAFEGNLVEYETDIPVAVGGQVVLQMACFGEVPTAGTASMEVIFDSAKPTGKNSMSQQINAAMTTTADAWAALDTITVPQLQGGANPTKIKGLFIGIPTDQATLALLRCASRIRLTGAGIAEGGLHEFLGPQSGTGCNTAGILGYSRQYVKLDVDIPVNAGGQIVVEQYLATETPTAGTVVVGVQYA